MKDKDNYNRIKKIKQALDNFRLPGAMSDQHNRDSRDWKPLHTMKDKRRYFLFRWDWEQDRLRRIAQKEAERDYVERQNAMEQGAGVPKRAT